MAISTVMDQFQNDLCLTRARYIELICAEHDLHKVLRVLKRAHRLGKGLNKDQVEMLVALTYGITDEQGGEQNG